MMKFIFMTLFLIFMVIYKNYYLMFYYNLCFLMSLIMLFMFMNNSMIFMCKVMFWSGFDMFSYFLILLSFWILGLMFMTLDELEGHKKFKLIMFILMLFILLSFFLSMNLIMFYIFFEVVLIPTFFLVIYWGGNPERISAALYLLMYMLVFSLPMLYYIFKMYFYNNSLNLMIMESYNQMMDLSFSGFLIIMGAFLVKLPIYMFHIWLPKAHVEAPVYGSMILAGILLKLGGYGLLRLMMIFIHSCLEFGYLIFSVSIIGSFYMGILCLIQIDMKMLVAYSSVVHMNMMLSSLMTLFKLGFFSSFIMMISHGLCSSGLFYMVNLYYKWSSSRLLILNKGMMNLFPMMSFWWFLLCIANFSFPFSLNFISEIFMISVIVSWEKMFIYYLMMICFFSSAYSLYLYSYIQHGGGVGWEMSFKIMGQMKEFIVVSLHFYPLVLMLLNLIMFM